MLMPVAFFVARRNRSTPSNFLMPMAFGSLLGGIVTLIGTSPNIIVARVREQIVGEPFGMFDLRDVHGEVAASFADSLGYDRDPFLMAVAIGAACDFLTPIGHQSNLLVMGPGGYSFGDYWRLGLPLSIMVVVVGVPLIALFWPFRPV